MTRETGLVWDDRTEWPDKGAVRHRFHCADCDLRGKVTGGPIAAIDQLADAIAAAHAHQHAGGTHA